MGRRRDEWEVDWMNGKEKGWEGEGMNEIVRNKEFGRKGKRGRKRNKGGGRGGGRGIKGELWHVITPCLFS